MGDIVEGLAGAFGLRAAVGGALVYEAAFGEEVLVEECIQHIKVEKKKGGKKSHKSNIELHQYIYAKKLGCTPRENGMDSSLLQETNNRKQRLKQLYGQKQQPPQPPQPPQLPQLPQPAVGEEPEEVVTEDTVAKPANWDLKRDLQQKLDQLQPRNEQAIADLIRKRIQESNNIEDLAQVINSR